MTSESNANGSAGQKSGTASSGTWLVYTSMALGGLLLLGEAFEFYQLQKWTAKIGIALLFSAFSLVVGNGRKSGYLAAAIIWVVVIGFFAYGFTTVR